MYRAKSMIDNKYVIGDYFSDPIENKYYIREYNSGCGYPNFIPPDYFDHEINLLSLRIFSGYYIDIHPIFIGDILSNNFGTDKEVLREVVEYEGCKMMKRIKGNSSMPEYISLHEHHKFNYKIIEDGK